jgi:hypothetical protein
MTGQFFAVTVRRTMAILGAGFVVLGLAGVAPAGIITWGTPTTVSGDSDVDTTGTLLYAYNIGTSGVAATTINGVTFAAFAFPGENDGLDTVTVGSVNFTESPAILQSYDASTLGTNSSPFGGLSPAYKTMLSTGGTALQFSTITATFGGLTVGHQYRLQWWTSNPKNGVGLASETFATTTAESGGNQVTLDSNSTNIDGGLGQFVIGTFTADATSQTFTLDSPVGNTSPLINGFQVRVVSAPVPEIDPAGMGSVLALVTGALGLLERRRLKAKVA